MKFIIKLIFICICSNLHSQEEIKQNIQQDTIWEKGDNGYHTYRIPAIVVTKNNTILAFAEGRKNHGGDSGNIDLVMKRSSDGGKTWSKQIVVWDDGKNTCGNPSPVVDQNTGTIWLLSTWNRGEDREHQIIKQHSKDTRRVFVMSSNDDGVTWSKAKEITTDVKKKNWTWYATGPGSGIQIQKGKFAGRMVVACDHIEAKSRHYYSHIIYSDDNGKSWKLGGRTPKHKVNECEVVELTDGQLMLNMRNYDRSKKKRQVASSSDGGITWENQGFDNTLIEPICQASIQRFSWPGAESKNVILFSNPASTRRNKMTVRASFDDGKSWTVKRQLNAGPSAYSDLAVLNNGTVLCLYERGKRGAYDEISLAKFELSDLE